MACDRIFRSSTAALLAASVTLLASEGCATFSVEETSPAKGSPPRAASLRFSVYENRTALKKAEVFGGSVRSRLLRLDPAPGEALFESADASWSAELPPGKYRLEVSQRTGPEPGSAEIGSWRESFRVKTGEEVSAVIILHDSRPWVWAGTGFGIAVAAGVVGLLVLVGFVSLGTKGITFSRGAGSGGAASRASSEGQRPGTPSQPRVP
jgi:hypothetical protein